MHECGVHTLHTHSCQSPSCFPETGCLTHLETGGLGALVILHPSPGAAGTYAVTLAFYVGSGDVEPGSP